MNTKEEWRPIVGYEGEYLVSNTGKIKSLISNRILHPAFCGRGYLKVVIRVEPKHYKNVMIHRAVAEAFIPNPEGKLTVNHIDGNKLNNNANNLEWATYSENLKHAYRKGLNYWTPKKGKPFRAVVQIDAITGEILKEYASVIDAAKTINAYNSSVVSDICAGRLVSAKGVIFRYKDEYEQFENVKDFVIRKLKPAKTNIHAYELYDVYLANYNLPTFTKHGFYKLLDDMGLLSSCGRIGTLSTCNILKNVKIAE